MGWCLWACNKCGELWEKKCAMSVVRGVTGQRQNLGGASRELNSLMQGWVLTSFQVEEEASSLTCGYGNDG